MPAVPATPSGFLEIGLNGVRQVDVDDKSDIRFIDAHPKSIGGDDDS